MMTLNFTLDLRSGQVPGERPNFENQNFLPNTYLSCPVVSQDSKNDICFVVRQLEIRKIKFQKVDVITITRFLGYCTAKNKDIGSNLCSHVDDT